MMSVTHNTTMRKIKAVIVTPKLINTWGKDNMLTPITPSTITLLKMNETIAKSFQFMFTSLSRELNLFFSLFSASANTITQHSEKSNPFWELLIFTYLLRYNYGIKMSSILTSNFRVDLLFNIVVQTSSNIALSQ